MKASEAFGKGVAAVFGTIAAMLYFAIGTALSLGSIAGIVFLILFLVGAGPWAPQTGFEELNGLVRYTNGELGYSIDFPSDWVLEPIGEQEIAVGPEAPEYNYIQVGVYEGEPIIGTLPDSIVAATTAATVEAALELMGATDVQIGENGPVVGKWDWLVTYSATYEDTFLEGQLAVIEVESTDYILVLMRETDWPEGYNALESFQLIR